MELAEKKDDLPLYTLEKLEEELELIYQKMNEQLSKKHLPTIVKVYRDCFNEFSVIFKCLLEQKNEEVAFKHLKDITGFIKEEVFDETYFNKIYEKCKMDDMERGDTNNSVYRLYEEMLKIWFYFVTDIEMINKLQFSSDDYFPLDLEILSNIKKFDRQKIIIKEYLSDSKCENENLKLILSGDFYGIDDFTFHEHYETIIKRAEFFKSQGRDQEAFNLINYVILSFSSTWNDSQFEDIIKKLEVKFEIETSFIFCLFQLSEKTKYYYRDEFVSIKKKIFSYGDSEEFPSLQTLATEIIVSKLFEESKDDLKKICQCFVSMSYSVQKLFIFHFFVEILCHERYDLNVFHNIVETHSNILIFKYGMKIIRAISNKSKFNAYVLSSVCRPAQKLGKLYVERLLQNIKENIEKDSDILCCIKQFEELNEPEVVLRLAVIGLSKNFTDDFLSWIHEECNKNRKLFERISNELMNGVYGLPIWESLIENIKGYENEKIEMVKGFYQMNKTLFFSSERKKIGNSIICSCPVCSEIQTLCMMSSVNKRISFPKKMNTDHFKPFIKQYPNILEEHCWEDFQNCSFDRQEQFCKIILTQIYELLHLKYNGSIKPIVDEIKSTFKDHCCLIQFSLLLSKSNAKEEAMKLAIFASENDGYSNYNTLKELIEDLADFRNECSKQLKIEFGTKISKRYPLEFKELQYEGSISDLLEPCDFFIECTDLPFLIEHAKKTIWLKAFNKCNDKYSYLWRELVVNSHASKSLSNKNFQELLISFLKEEYQHPKSIDLLLHPNVKSRMYANSIFVERMFFGLLEYTVLPSTYGDIHEFLQKVCNIRIQCILDSFDTKKKTIFHEFDLFLSSILDEQIYDKESWNEMIEKIINHKNIIKKKNMVEIVESYFQK
eukprot:gene8127-12587_t